MPVNEFLNFFLLSCISFCTLSGQLHRATVLKKNLKIIKRKQEIKKVYQERYAIRRNDKFCGLLWPYLNNCTIWS